MSSTIKVEIVSAEQQLWSGEGVMVFAPALMGEVGIAPRHTQMLSPLKAGDVRVQTENGDEEFFYVRMRIDADPLTDGDALMPTGWAVEFDIDLDRYTYELIAIVNGSAPQQVQLLLNYVCREFLGEKQPKSRIEQWQDRKYA